jgi:hypothetical protein
MSCPIISTIAVRIGYAYTIALACFAQITKTDLAVHMSQQETHLFEDDFRAQFAEMNEEFSICFRTFCIDGWEGLLRYFPEKEI